MSTAPLWLALIAFETPQACDAFNDALRLQERWEPQCILIEPSAERIDIGPASDLAPTASARPMPRPTRSAP